MMEFSSISRNIHTEAKATGNGRAFLLKNGRMNTAMQKAEATSTNPAILEAAP